MDESSTDYQKIVAYVDSHPVGVVSTVDERGLPEAAAVYVFSVSHHTVCFVTRNLTRKYQNIYARGDVAITLYDDSDVSTLQITGKAFVANAEHMLSYAMDKINQLFKVRGDAVSPLAKMDDAGDYVLIGVEISYARLRLFQGIDANLSMSYEEHTIGNLT